MSIAERIKTIIAHYQLNASSFADKIGVPRSSISHLLSGRNKPSLDFILKLVNTFPEVNLYWLLNGKGTFPDTNGQSAPTSSKDKTPKPSFREKSISTTTAKSSNPSKEIDKIVVFYTDGSFESYNPKN
ncbi:helix-turn-helix transcriptional regulator [uncultured Croceitalea sp.]|uniref:helix-turn-helix domain-containing protein n=1 Tax=uncultured Croceitalea sp. TaxID=1798908 RepID=UPI003305F2CC